MARLNELCIGSEEARPLATAVKSLVSWGISSHIFPTLGILHVNEPVTDKKDIQEISQEREYWLCVFASSTSRLDTSFSIVGFTWWTGRPTLATDRGSISTVGRGPGRLLFLLRSKCDEVSVVGTFLVVLDATAHSTWMSVTR